MNRLTKLIIALTLPLVAGLIGSLATMPAIPTWYATLTKPSFSPPNWLFGPVWTSLYLLMGIAFYRIWTREGNNHNVQRQAMIIFVVHLIFNVLWSILFFGLRSPLLGLIDIFVLVILIVSMIIMFYRLDRIAAYLLIPYLAWVTFATILNAAIWQLN